jgi:hypothetical protein
MLDYLQGNVSVYQATPHHIAEYRNNWLLRDKVDQIAIL